ncbi:MAG TPA: ATP-binding cassette domain-containing protein, partial [Chthoniobacterales bacterium]
MIQMVMPVQERSAPVTRPQTADEPASGPAFEIKNLSIWYGQKQAIRDVSVDIPSNNVTAIIGPSGCGKSTLLRCLNRMHELVPNTRVEGGVLFHGSDLYGAGVDPTL